MSHKHRAAFNSFSATFAEDCINEWKEMLATWQEDTSAPNPFEETLLGKVSIHRLQTKTETGL